MKINEFSKATGLSPRAIRLYEEKGLLKSLREPENRYRIYSQKQISVGKTIKTFRQIGFSVKDILAILKVSPELKIQDVKNDLQAHLIRLKYQLHEAKNKIVETENLIYSLNKEKPLTKKQVQLFEGFSHSVLRKSSANYTQAYLKRENLGHDEELQMLASSYAHLFLMAAAQGSMKEFSDSHKLISKCLTKIGEDRLSQRHLKVANSYAKM